MRILSTRKLFSVRRNVFIAVLLSLMGCATSPENSRYNERCTSIVNVTKKNYLQSAKLHIPTIFGGGFETSETGVVVSPEAAERLMNLDQLCRSWVFGAISDDEWSDVSIKYILASSAGLAKSDDPEAKQYLENMQVELNKIFRQFAKNPLNDELDPDKESNKLRKAIRDYADSSKTLADLKSELNQEHFDLIYKAVYRSSYEHLLDDNEKKLKVLQGDLSLSRNDTLKALSEIQTRLNILSNQFEQTSNDIIQPKNPADNFRKESKKPLVANLYFDKGTFSLSENAKSIINDSLTGMNVKELEIEVLGYTDDSGSDIQNSFLSLARAQEVRDLLINEYQVPAKRITVLGHQRGVRIFGSSEKNRVAIVRIFNSP